MPLGLVELPDPNDGRSFFLMLPFWQVILPLRAINFDSDTLWIVLYRIHRPVAQIHNLAITDLVLLLTSLTAILLITSFINITPHPPFACYARLVTLFYLDWRLMSKESGLGGVPPDMPRPPPLARMVGGNCGPAAGRFWHAANSYSPPPPSQAK